MLDRLTNISRPFCSLVSFQEVNFIIGVEFHAESRSCPYMPNGLKHIKFYCVIWLILMELISAQSQIPPIWNGRWCMIMCGSIASENVFSEQSGILKDIHAHTLNHHPHRSSSYFKFPLLPSWNIIVGSLKNVCISTQLQNIDLGEESINKYKRLHQC